MMLWIFQMGLNLFFAASILYALRTRRRMRELEGLFSHLEGKFGSTKAEPKLEVASETAPSKANIEKKFEKLGEKNLTMGQVVEKATLATDKGANVAERYEKAELLMNKGYKIQDVASETGLSLSELRLLEKISTKSH